MEVPLDAEATGESLIPDSEFEGVRGALHRAAPRVSEWRWCRWSTRSRRVSTTPDTARLYQVRLQVTALDGQRAVFAGHNDPELSPPPSDRDDELLHLAAAAPAGARLRARPAVRGRRGRARRARTGRGG